MADHHYRGRLAYWYDRLLHTESGDIDFYREAVRRRGSSALELACGTGRLLLPLLEAGIDVEGVDVSCDMLEECRRKVRAAGLRTRLFQQDMANFHTGRRYDVVYVSGASFQLLTEIDKVRSSLAAIHGHLVEGGWLLLDLMQPEHMAPSPETAAWREMRSVAEGPERFTAWGREWADPLDTVMHGEYRYEFSRDGIVEETVRDRLGLRWYGRTEFLRLLVEAGFTPELVEPVNIITSHSNALYYEAARE